MLDLLAQRQERQIGAVRLPILVHQERPPAGICMGPALYAHHAVWASEAAKLCGMGGISRVKEAGLGALVQAPAVLASQLGVILPLLRRSTLGGLALGQLVQPGYQMTPARHSPSASPRRPSALSG